MEGLATFEQVFLRDRYVVHKVDRWLENPSVSPGDLLIFDFTCDRVDRDGTYLLNFGGDLCPRICHREINGVHIMPSRARSPVQVVPNDRLDELMVVGRIVWHFRQVE